MSLPLTEEVYNKVIDSLQSQLRNSSDIQIQQDALDYMIKSWRQKVQQSGVYINNQNFEKDSNQQQQYNPINLNNLINFQNMGNLQQMTLNANQVNFFGLNLIQKQQSMVNYNMNVLDLQYQHEQQFNNNTNSISNNQQQQESVINQNDEQRITVKNEQVVNRKDNSNVFENNEEFQANEEFATINFHDITDKKLIDDDDEIKDQIKVKIEQNDIKNDMKLEKLITEAPKLELKENKSKISFVFQTNTLDENPNINVKQEATNLKQEYINDQGSESDSDDDNQFFNDFQSKPKKVKKQQNETTAQMPDQTKQISTSQPQIQKQTDNIFNKLDDKNKLQIQQEDKLAQEQPYKEQPQESEGELLGSDDDIDEYQINLDTNNQIYGYYDKVFRVKEKWKAVLKNVIARFDDKEYVFHQLNGDWNFSMH